MRARSRAVAAALVAALAGRAAAQDFACPAPAGPAPSAGAMLETGLPPARPLPWLECSFTRWYALPGLEGRALATGLTWGSLRVAAGMSQTGEESVGWSAAGLALGAASRAGGFGARGVARRDLATSSAPGEVAGPLGTGLGVEAGGGAWFQAARGVRLWASVPQVWTRGATPPLARPLEIGLTREGRSFTFWLSRGSPAEGADAQHSAGVRVRSGGLAAWALARDRPLRGGVGVEAGHAGLRVTGAVEGHPVLGETVRAALAFGAPGP